ncbi:MAG: CRISPR-associated endonuclease Cas6 [Thermoplasmatales archaeon]|nr:CRISPR-associated endonuclease Cas6 [Thermoplasmatales archaeon]
MNVRVLITALKTDKPVKENASMLRGYIGNKFKENIILHHHVGGNESLYAYPRIQYKIIENTPIIVGIEEGVEILKNISDGLKELILGRSRYKILSIQMNQLNAEFGKCRENIKYRFLLPWLALNQENYKKYKEINDWKEKKKFLNGILIGNILSMCKSLDYIVAGKLYSHSLLNEEIVKYKGIFHTTFTGEFRINFKIPDYLGIGKGVSHGFGTIKRVKND